MAEARTKAAFMQSALHQEFACLSRNGMTLAAFIDLVLTPLGGGVGAVIGLSIVARKQPDSFEKLSNWSIRLLVGAAVAIALFVIKIF